MVDPIPDNEQPSEQQTRLRPAAEQRHGNTPTRPYKNQPEAGSAPLQKRRAWLIGGIAVTGIAAVAVVLVLWLRPGPEMAPELPLPPPQEIPVQPELPPEEITRPDASLPVEHVPAEEEPVTISAYQQRLMALGTMGPDNLSDTERERRQQQLFNLFEQAVQAGNLSLPAADSATEYLIQLTALAPDDGRVLQARSLLVQSYLDQAREARDAGRWDEADGYLQSAIEIRLSRTYLQEAGN